MATKANSKPNSKKPAKSRAAAARKPAGRDTASSRAKTLPASIKALVKDGLACPSCVSQDFRFIEKNKKGYLNCASCGGVYPIHHGSPFMIDNRALLRMDPELLGAWRVSQNNSLEEYRSDSAHSVSKAARDDVQQVIRYLEVYGMKVLDIGSGVYAPPEYLTEAGAANIIGLDPLVPETEPDLNLVGGIAEYTPFVDASFDAVTIITSADHLIDIENGLRECARVLKPGGAIFVWIEYAADPKLLRKPTPFQRLPREKFAESKGAESDYKAWKEAESELDAFNAKVDKAPKKWSKLMVDNYHLHHLGKTDWVASLANAGLEIIADKPVTYPSGGQNNFLVIKKVADRALAGPPELQTLNMLRAIPEVFEQTAKVQAELTQQKLNELNASLDSVRESVASADGGASGDFDARFQNLANMIDALMANTVESNLVSANEIKSLVGELNGGLNTLSSELGQTPAAVRQALQSVELALAESGREALDRASAQEALISRELSTVDQAMAQLRDEIARVSEGLPADRTDELRAQFEEISDSLHAAVASNVSAAELETGLSGIFTQMSSLSSDIKAAAENTATPADIDALKQAISQGLQPLAGAKSVEDGFSGVMAGVTALQEKITELQANALSGADLESLQNFAAEGVRRSDLEGLELFADQGVRKPDLDPLNEFAEEGARKSDLESLKDFAAEGVRKSDLDPLNELAKEGARKDDLANLDSFAKRGATKADIQRLERATAKAATKDAIEGLSKDIKASSEVAARQAKQVEINLDDTRKSLDKLVSEKSDSLGRDLAETQAKLTRHVDELKKQIDAAEQALQSASSNTEKGISSQLDRHLENSIAASKESLAKAELAISDLIGRLPAQIDQLVDDRLSRAEAELAQRLEARMESVQAQLAERISPIPELIDASVTNRLNEAVTNRIDPKVDSVRITMLDQGTYFESLIGGATEAANTANAGISRIEAALAYKGPVRRGLELTAKILFWPFLQIFKLFWLLLWPLRKTVKLGLRFWSIFLGKTHKRLRMRILRALFRPAPRRKNLGKRIMMITISQIEIDPRINKAARTLAEAGWEVDIMCQQPNIVDEDITFEDVYPGVRWVRVKWKPDYIRFWNWYQDIYAHALETLHYDYIHVNDLTAAAVGWMASRAKGVPMIYDAHEMWSENVFFDGEKYVEMPLKDRLFGRWYEGFMLKYTDSFFSVSNSINVEYERRYGKKPLLLANFPDVANMDIDTTDYPSVRDMAGISDDKFVTIYIGGLGPARNIETIVEAHAHLDDDFVFVIRGPEAEKWGQPHIDQAHELGIEHRIKVLPGVGRDEVIAGMKGADAGVVMLKNLCKNFYWYYPNKFFEYQLGGLPVLVSNFPDVTEHIEREQSGITFDPADPVDAARAIRELASDREEARAMGQRGRDSILSTYNWEEAMKLMIAEYDRLQAESQS